MSLLLLCYLTAGLVAAKQRFNIRSLKATRSLTASGTVGTFSNPKQYTLTVTVGTRSPDCVSRKVILINGQFQPILRFTQGQWVAVSVDAGARLARPQTMQHPDVAAWLRCTFPLLASCYAANSLAKHCSSTC